MESDSIKDYQICSYGYMGSCSNWTFFFRTGCLDFGSLLTPDEVESDFIELGGQCECWKSTKNSDSFRMILDVKTDCATDCRRSHPFKWSATLKLPTMCIVQQRKQSLIGPHNPFVVLSSGSRTRRLIEHMIRGALIFLTIALLPPQTQFLVNFVFNKKVPKSQQMM